MTDTLRVVTFDAGGRPQIVQDLNSGPGMTSGYFRDRSAEFSFTPGVSNVQWARQARRYGGGYAAGETHDNGQIAWTAYVKGASLAIGTLAAETLVAALSSTLRGRFLQWAPEGGLSTYFEIAGPGTWVPAYNPVEFVQTNAMRIQLAFPVLPLARWDACTIGDHFFGDTTGDYVFDAGSVSGLDTATANGQLKGAGSLFTERRLRHVIRGYRWTESQNTLKYATGSTISSYKAGVLLRAVSSTQYIEVYVDDNGTNSRLRIDTVIGGTRTNRATVNLGSRMATNSQYMVRGRTEGDTVYAEFFTGHNAGPATTPTSSTSYTLGIPDIPPLDTMGYGGWSWIPQHSGAYLEMFESRPFTYRNLNFPRTISPKDVIPGTAPAQADVTITTSGGSGVPVFGLIGWAKRPSIGTPTSLATIASAGSTPPAGVVLGTVAANSNLSATADAGAIGAFSQKDAVVSGAETFVLGLTINTNAYAPDDFTDRELLLEVWARLQISSTVISPTATLAAVFTDGVAFAVTRFSNEWGSTGRLLTPPAGSLYRLYRLGTVTVPADAANLMSTRLQVTVTTGVGSTGVFAIDYMLTLPARQRCLSPSAVAQDAGYPVLMTTTNETSKTIRSNLSAAVSTPQTAGLTVPDHGLGGNLIEPPPGWVDWLLKLSNVVPDDPTPLATADQLTNVASVSIDVTPRSNILRAS